MYKRSVAFCSSRSSRGGSGLLQYEKATNAFSAASQHGEEGSERYHLEQVASANADALATMTSQQRSAALLSPGFGSARRWCREPNELCVKAATRHNRSLLEFNVSYKFEDPEWNRLLRLECGNPVSLEMRARHANVHLKHLVCSGHNSYYLTLAKHSVLHPRGVAERSHCVASLGKSSRRLVLTMIHEGPLDITKGEDSPRGVVALSESHSLATSFSRREMWKRTRRIGAVQSKMGALDYELWDPSDVGRRSDAEVLLLGKETEEFSGSLKSKGIISSLQMPKHPFHYVGHFEAPSTTAIDAVHQLSYVSATHHGLVERKTEQGTATAGNDVEDEEVVEDEKLHAIAWHTGTGHPYQPLEMDLPFELLMSSPSVHTSADTYPQKSRIGTPFLSGAPVAGVEFKFMQGATDYIYDQAPSSRSATWWQQNAIGPYAGNFWTARDGNLDRLQVCEEVKNPFAPTDAEVAMERKKKLARLGGFGSSARTQRRVRRSASALRRLRAGEEGQKK